MILPFDRDALRERNAIDAAEELAEIAPLSPEERLSRTLEISELVRELARAMGTGQPADERAELEEKSRLWAVPLSLLARGL